MDNMQPLWASRSLHTPFRLLDPSLFLASMQLLVVETRLCASATVYSLYVNTFYKSVTVCSFEAVTSASCMSTASVRTEKFMWHDASQQAGPLVMERSWPCTFSLCSLGWSWSWWLEWCERKILLAGWWLEAGTRAVWEQNTVGLEAAGAGRTECLRLFFCLSFNGSFTVRTFWFRLWAIYAHHHACTHYLCVHWWRNLISVCI